MELSLVLTKFFLPEVLYRDLQYVVNAVCEKDGYADERQLRHLEDILIKNDNELIEGTSSSEAWTKNDIKAKADITLKNCVK